MDDEHVYRVLDKLEAVRRIGGGWMARCPAHHDPTPSLSISLGHDARLLLHCHAGCDWRRVCEAGEIDPQDLFPPKEHVVKSNGHSSRVVAKTYDYRDEGGELLYQVVRYDPKGFRQRRPLADGGWDWTLGDVRRVIYRLPDVLAALEKNPGRWVFLVEGEKDADTLAGANFIATTFVGGAGRAPSGDELEPLRGQRIALLSDNDAAGRERVSKLRGTLTGIAEEVRLVDLPGLQDKEDVTDWFARGAREERAAALKELVALSTPGEAADLDSGPPQFPLDVLPGAVRRYIEETAASVPIPPEMVAIPMLSEIGGLIGNRAHLRLKRGWAEYGGMYMLVVAGPGTNKSAAIRHARWPLRALQQDAKRLYDLLYEDYKQERSRWKATPAAERGDEPRAPKMRHYFTTDVNLERLASMLEVSPGVCIMSDELAGWVKRMNQYRQGGDREQYLSIWASEPMKVDRQSREVYVETPVVSVFGGIQPDVVPSLHSDSQVRDGFVERLLPFLPVLPPKVWDHKVEVSTEAYSGVADLFRAIDRLPLADPAGGESGEPPGLSIQLSPEANRRWGRWYNENNALARELGGFLGGFYIKLEAHVARFALILHVIKHAHGDPRVMIETDTMLAAIDLGEYFRGQIRLFLPLLLQGAPTSTKSAGLLARIERAICRKGQTVKVSNNTNEEMQDAICIGSHDLLRGLGVKKEDVTRELDTQTDHSAIFTTTIETGANPKQAYCILQNENQHIRQFDGSTDLTVSVPAPESVVNGRWEEKDPWD